MVETLKWASAIQENEYYFPEFKTLVKLHLEIDSLQIRRKIHFSGRKDPNIQTTFNFLKKALFFLLGSKNKLVSNLKNPTE